ncbi:MAG: CDF family Co(II)/Ni(II) efflux transporter DmeF [Polyangiales bacterium]
MHHELGMEVCTLHQARAPRRKERRVLAVVALTATMMVLEIAVGYATSSMALLADGWHMATHVGALGLASFAYAASRRYAGHRLFALGTGKIRALAGYTSALVLGLTALVMIVESVQRLFAPREIDVAASLPVAVLGLLVNLLSVFLLHDDHHEHDHGHDHHHHEHDHHHDHNHRAALLHVIADTLTSALAIAALLAVRHFGWTWLDALTGVLGGVLILHWGAELCRVAALDLLDAAPSPDLEQAIRGELERGQDVVRDLHIWSLGEAHYGCVATLISDAPEEPKHYHQRLARFGLAHLTVEVQRCPDHGAV